MKKVLLFMATFFVFAYITNAKTPFETKAQFVKWTTVPGVKNVKPSWLKNAMQGKNIEGAIVNATADAYKKVLGEDLYNKVLAGDNNRFKIELSKGGEINWAIGSKGEPIRSGILAKGVYVIYFDDQLVAKWGTNGCLNALSVAPSYTDDGEDPDNQREVVTAPTLSGPNSNTNFNSNVFSNDVPWNTGYGIYSQGRNDRTAAFSEDALMFMAIQKSAGSNCNTCPSTNATVSYQQPSMYMSSQTYAQAPQNSSLDMNVRQKPNALDWINTAANVANTAFNGINTFRGYRLEGSSSIRSGYYSTNPSVRRPVGGFQGSNQLGFSSIGTTGGGIGTGGWTNTWPN